MTGSTLITPAARSDAASPRRGARGSGWFGHVLVGVDGSPTGRDAIELGNVLRDPSGRFTLAHVLLSQAPSYRDFHATPGWANSRRMLERESEASGVAAELTGMASPSVSGGLHQLAEDCGADLLVVGACSRGSVGRLLRGDDTRGSLSGAACAVAVAPHRYAERSREIKTIGVAYNDTPEAEAALVAARNCGLALAQLLLSDKLALRAVGARVVSVQDAAELHALVERLCIQANMPKPRLAIANTATPNAFAIGRSPKNAVVCATTGLLDVLEQHELEGVLAHELSHIQNRDVLVMTLASFFATVAALVAQIGLFASTGGRNRDGQPALIVIVAVSFAVYMISYFLMLALSRYREFAADRGAALVTGRPAALASALMRLSETVARTPDRDLRTVGQLNAFFIVPLRGRGALQTLFSTHPPIEQRIARLQQLEAELQQAR
jgi:heat shock protein HtpX